MPGQQCLSPGVPSRRPGFPAFRCLFLAAGLSLRQITWEDPDAVVWRPPVAAGGEDELRSLKNLFLIPESYRVKQITSPTCSADHTHPVTALDS